MNTQTSYSAFVTKTRNGKGAYGGAIVDSLASAREHAEILLSNDENRLEVEISSTTYCMACSGSGRVRGRRRILEWKPCKSCKGVGELAVDIIETVTRETQQ